MPTTPDKPTNEAADGSKAAFSNAAELQKLKPRTLKDDLLRLLPSTAHEAKLFSVTALAVAGGIHYGPKAVHAMEHGGREQSPAWTVAKEPNLPTDGSSEDTSHFRHQLQHQSQVPGALVELQLGTAADGKGILTIRNPVVSESNADKTVLGVTTGEGPATFTLNTHHFEINVVEGDNSSGPVTVSYTEARQLIQQYTQEVTLDSNGLNSMDATLTGHIQDPDLDEKQLGVLVRHTMGPDDESSSARG